MACILAPKGGRIASSVPLIPKFFDQIKDWAELQPVRRWKRPRTIWQAKFCRIYSRLRFIQTIQSNRWLSACWRFSAVSEQSFSRNIFSQVFFILKTSLSCWSTILSNLQSPPSAAALCSRPLLLFTPLKPSELPERPSETPELSGFSDIRSNARESSEFSDTSKSLCVYSNAQTLNMLFQPTSFSRSTLESPLLAWNVLSHHQQTVFKSSSCACEAAWKTLLSVLTSPLFNTRTSRKDNQTALRPPQWLKINVGVLSTCSCSWGLL